MTPHTHPLVSVVIPSYNHGGYLGRALQSVLDQTYTHWEAFVIDNHSTDNTDEVLSRFPDPRIKVLKIHNNGVIAASRNMGIRAANGAWVAFLDSDDWWTADKLQICLSEVHEQADLVYHSLEIITDRSSLCRNRLIKSWQVKTPVLVDLLARGNALATSSVMVKTSLLQQLHGLNERPDMAGAEDYNTWLRVAQKSERFRYVNRRLGYYQLHPKGNSSGRDMSIPARHAVADFLGFLCKKQRNKLEANLKYTSGRHQYLSNNFAQAKNDLTFSMHHGKLALKPKVLFMLSIIWLAR